MAHYPSRMTLMLPAIHLLLIKLPFYGQNLSPIIDKNLLLMFSMIGGEMFFYSSLCF